MFSTWNAPIERTRPIDAPPMRGRPLRDSLLPVNRDAVPGML